MVSCGRHNDLTSELNEKLGDVQVNELNFHIVCIPADFNGVIAKFSVAEGKNGNDRFGDAIQKWFVGASEISLNHRIQLAPSYNNGQPTFDDVTKEFTLSVPFLFENK